MKVHAINFQIPNPGGILNTQPQVFEVVPRGHSFYGFIIDWVVSEGLTLRYGRTAGGMSMAIKDGSRFIHRVTETNGLYLLLTTDWLASADGATTPAVMRIFILDEDPGVEICDFGSIWDRAQTFQTEAEQTAVGGAKALILLNNFSPGMQAGVALARFAQGQYGSRLARVQSVLLESTTTGRVRLLWTGAGAGGNAIVAAPTVLSENPSPLGWDNVAGGVRVSGGADPGIAGTLLAHPVVTAGANSGLSDLAWRIAETWALAIADDNINTTLYASLNYQVAKINPEAG